MGKNCLIVLILVCGLSVAQAEIGAIDDFSFEIPEGWYVAENNSDKIILSDNISAIRIDVTNINDLEFSQMILEDMQQVKGKLKYVDINTVDPNFWEMMQELQPWEVNGAAGKYYLVQIYKMSSHQGGTGISVTPKGIDYVSAYVCPNNTEWVFGWVQGGKMVGVHAIFEEGNYEMIPYDEGYISAESTERFIQKPLNDVVTSFGSEETNDILGRI